MNIKKALDSYRDSLSAKGKAIFIAAAAFFGLLIIFLPLSLFTLQRGFAELEQTNTTRSIQQIQKILEDEITNIDLLTKDWASWDDTYQYAIDHQSDYITANYSLESQANLHISLVAILDEGGNILFIQAVDWLHSAEMPTPDIAPMLAANPSLVSHLTLESKQSGLTILDDKPILVSSHPIITSKLSGPIKGTLIFGRFLDDFEIERLSTLSQIQIEIIDLRQIPLKSQWGSIVETLKKQPYFIQPIDEERIAGFGTLYDLNKKPLALLKTEQGRDIYQLEKTYAAIFTGIFLLVALTFSFVGERFLNRYFSAKEINVSNLTRYRTVIRQVSDGIFLVDENGMVLDANQASEKLLGLAPESSIGKTLLELFPGITSAEIEHDLLVYEPSNEAIPPREWQFVDSTGETIFVEITSSQIIHLHQKVWCINLRNITSRKKAEMALQESDERYELATRGANDGLWDWNLLNNKMVYSTRWKNMLGFGENEIGNSPDEWFNRIHPAEVERLRTELSTHTRHRSGHFELEHRMRHRDGGYRWMLTRGMANWNEEGFAYRMAGSLTDITARKQMEDQLRRDAFYDSLTQLPNRMLLIDRIRHASERARRRTDFTFAILALDFDRFKVINDGLGHSAGDQVLVESAERLKRCLRSADTVARIGGDEFIILLEEIVAPEEAVFIAERIQQELKTAFNVNSHQVFISVSIGIVMFQSYYHSIEELIRDADLAMYDAKRRGGAGYSVFNKVMHSMAMARLELESDLRQAIERQEFVLFYQPIIDLDSRRISGFEALIRWQHSRLGMLLPDRFIPLAEETGLIVPLGKWVLSEACTQLAKWQEEYPQDPPLGMRINLSSRQFASQTPVQAILTETGIPPSSLSLEITESTVMQDFDTATETLLQLRDIGVHLEIDDFGTGYSSLSYLQKLPVNGIKIDRSFIRGIENNDSNTNIVQTIISLAHKLGFHVIAEGVETPDQMARLRSLDCEFGQGFLFHKPMPADEAEHLLRG